jgi:hypothetical protein
MMLKLIMTDMDEGLAHPLYSAKIADWHKWRLCYEGGEVFRDEYLEQFSTREDGADFEKRRRITPIPTFAKEAIIDTKNAIYQRAVDIERIGGSNMYRECMRGNEGGVDLRGSNMDTFIGQQVLPELLSMGKVGIFIDMPLIDGPTLADTEGLHPYVYMFKAEQIINWSYDNHNRLTAVLLRYNEPVYDDSTGLTIKYQSVFRLLRLENGVVNVYTYEKKMYTLSATIRISVIPFVIVEINESLMTDVADYQIALLNMESSDISYAIKSNFPFYTEQFDPKTEFINNQKQKVGVEHEGAKSGTGDVQVGTSQGRRYPLGTERPDFIHPSSEPLKVSMEKQREIRENIRRLVHLTLSNLSTKQASADSKDRDNEGLEGGLANIGQVLEATERQIAIIWHRYEGEIEPVTITYPRRYNIKSEATIIEESSKKIALIERINSVTAQKQVLQEVTYNLFASKVDATTLDKIIAEVNTSDVPIINNAIIEKDVESGLLSHEYVARDVRHYPEGDYQIATIEHAERIARIQAAQTPHVTTNELKPDSQVGKDIKSNSQDPETDPDGVKRVKGSKR